MATDMALLASVAGTQNACWRMYGWNCPAFTFGYSQKWEDIGRLLGENAALRIRRPTGGGLVDHSLDWTICLCIGSGHPDFRKPALDLYREFHRCEAEALLQCRIEVAQAPCPGSCRDPGSPSPGICFIQPEPYDLMEPETGRKLAGAAMKRNRDGILIQGSLDPSGFPGIDRTLFETALEAALPDWLGLSHKKCGPLPEDTMLEKKFSSEAWNRRR